MAGFFRRLINFGVGLDEAFNALLGSSPRKTLSGSVGRALMAKKWWAPAAKTLIDGLPWFGAGHCLRTALEEEAWPN